MAISRLIRIFPAWAFVSLLHFHLALMAWMEVVGGLVPSVATRTTTSGSTVDGPRQEQNTFARRATQMEDEVGTVPQNGWEHVEMGPPDAILGIAQAFRSSTDPRKVNVCVGAYRDENGKPWVLPSVRKAEQKLLQDESNNKEYLSIEGDQGFVSQALRFAYGGNDESLLERIAGVQTLSGTGACRVGGEFLYRFLPGATLYIPTPTWGNHWKIFKDCSLPTAPYRYFNAATNSLDLEGMCEDLRNAPVGSIVLLHACAHNPTGCDPVFPVDWEQIVSVIEERRHIVFFDSAYQGFASGDAEKDASALQYVVERPSNIPVLLAQSFAKNFGLYGERCGTLSIVCKDADEKERVMSQLRNIIRPMYSSPPRHGSSIVKTVLNDAALTEQYRVDCASMAERIRSMRADLVTALKDAGSEHDWSHITRQIGMFAYTGMNADMCDELTDKYAIYLTRDGRISLAGLNPSNLKYVAESMHAVTAGKSITQ